MTFGHPSSQERPTEDHRALLLWPAEGGEVEVPPSPATRGHCTDVITATPWAQSTQSTGGSTWSTGDPFIANESPTAFASIREIRWRSENEPSTALFWRSRWDQLQPLWSYCGQVDGKRSCRLSRVNVVNRRPLHRQRESDGVRKHQRDPVAERKRTVYSSLLAITVGPASATVVLLRPGRRQAVLPSIQPPLTF
ncbi:hypothetical protein Taro_054184 [Colocasia esculenta]|uniref:Uncharacterized protein n=1 Tax=Colocasia esculenta TaxID=4460 RepID=A0A843XMV1_COLES|nr:hypothetical protein [Colocasia esculenta]